jgi:hypothetical protein
LQVEHDLGFAVHAGGREISFLTALMKQYIKFACFAKQGN